MMNLRVLCHYFGKNCSVVFKAEIQAISNSVQRMASTTSHALIFRNFGDPIEVIERIETTEDVFGKSLTGTQVRLKYLASPINPADINTIQGTYGVKPPLPHFAGNEGVAEVGPEVQNLKPGQWIIPATSEVGTWRTHSISVEDLLLPIEKEGMDVMAAAGLTVNPPTAYRMLRDYVKLTAGDTVIQNGANSAVGQTVIQLCKVWGINSINVIRSRPNDGHKIIENELKDLGATYVITEEQLRDKEVTKNLPKAKLTLNCVGGKNGGDCLRLMAPQAVMVTYGAMSKQPLPIPAGPLIFQDMQFVGYWNTRWTKEHPVGDAERSKMMSELCSLYRDGKIKAPKTVPFELKDFREALDIAVNPGFNQGKVVFVSSGYFCRGGSNQKN